MDAKDIERCKIPDCPACKLVRARAAGAAPNKYLPRKIPVARGQLKLGETPQGK